MLNPHPASPPYAIEGPTGRTIQIPPHFDPASDPYPAVTEGAALKAYYDREGYVVARGLIPPALCDAVVAAFGSEVKPHRGYFLRHASGQAEKHVFTEHGHMKFPIMNLQDLPRRPFAGFRRHGLELLTHARVQQVMAALLGHPGRVIHTMFFDGNQVTWAHHDSYYIDSAEIGAMVGLWVALEDIHPGAGRFYVCPRSHQLDLPKKGQDTDLDPNGDAYKAHVLRLIDAQGLECRAPALRKGDAILFSSRTIHGSLPSPEPRHSRKSITCHYIPRPHDFVWYHGQRPGRVKESLVNGVPVTHHRDLNEPKHRLVSLVQNRFPSAMKAVALLRGRKR